MIFLSVIAGFLLFFITMAVGVLFGRAPIAGSCGGLAQAGLDGECKVCGKTPGSCDPDKIPLSSNASSTLVTNAMPVSRPAIQRHGDPLDF